MFKAIIVVAFLVVSTYASILPRLPFRPSNGTFDPCVAYTNRSKIDICQVLKFPVTIKGVTNKTSSPTGRYD